MDYIYTIVGKYKLIHTNSSTGVIVHKKWWSEITVGTVGMVGKYQLPFTGMYVPAWEMRISMSNVIDPD